MDASFVRKPYFYYCAACGLRFWKGNRMLRKEVKCTGHTWDRMSQQQFRCKVYRCMFNDQCRHANSLCRVCGEIKPPQFGQQADNYSEETQSGHRGESYPRSGCNPSSSLPLAPKPEIKFGWKKFTIELLMRYDPSSSILDPNVARQIIEC